MRIKFRAKAAGQCGRQGARPNVVGNNAGHPLSNPSQDYAQYRSILTYSLKDWGWWNLRMMVVALLQNRPASFVDPGASSARRGVGLSSRINDAVHKGYDRLALLRYPGCPLSECGIGNNTDIPALLKVLRHLIGTQRKTLETLEKIESLQESKKILTLVIKGSGQVSPSALEDIEQEKEDTKENLCTVLAEEMAAYKELSNGVVNM
ncbi:hypothetical protein CALCODRAFT_510065 [Calocera cornea HHB12733]|uniref:Uncharacterized protein n=1 Tax=Calocera cornea HHB12733 TaxID=1353952 RepID=A0A165EUE8_9BASI|nr:hypothetical protein CALCODRAFT_510065 [Calocera cornea HHB12733]